MRSVKAHMIKCLFTEFESGRTGKYLAVGLGARTERSEVRMTTGYYFPVPPSHSVNKYIVRTSEVIKPKRKETG